MSNFAALSNGLSPPRPGTSVWKNECAFSFINASSLPDGLFINLTTFQAFARQYVPLDNSRTGNVFYLHHLQTKTPIVEEESASPKASNTDKDGRPTKLAIGVAGGFDVEGKKFTIKNTYTAVTFPALSVSDGLVFSDEEGVDNSSLPASLRETIAGLLRHNDSAEKKAVEAWSAENEMVFESKFARNLEQLDNGVKISSDPSTWACAESGIKENLWLNLSTGHIGSGRRNWDGTGGTGAALTHYQQTGSKYPLAVKLGTISERGADVYSYSPDEDGMVTDPLLAQHLAHWGIDVGKMEKTVKTVAELEVEMNANYDWSKITEGVDQLENVHGSGLVGLQNLGNSCYLNSIVQVLMSLDSFRKRFGWAKTPSELGTGLLSGGNVQSTEPQLDPLVQLTKLASGLSDPEWQCAKNVDDDEWSLRPTMLKLALAGDNSDFCGGEQQDAQEFLMHVLGAIERAHARHNGSSSYTNVKDDPTQAFRFHMQSRVEDLQSQKVKYLKTSISILSLSVPSHLATKVGGTGEDAERLQLDFHDCLRTSVGYDKEAAATIEDYLSPVTGQRGVAVTNTSMVTMPKYLWVSVNRYVMDGWVPKKLEIDIAVPETLDLSNFRARGGGGMQVGEEALPEEASGGGDEAPKQVEPDEALVAQLVGMGFAVNGCKRAAVATNNGSMEAAMEWVLTNMADPDFDTPLPADGGAVSAAAMDVDAGAPPGVDMLTSMGFSAPAALLALKTNGNDVERAANWLFNHTDDIDALVAADAAAGNNAGAAADGAAESSSGVVDHEFGKYRMRGIVSHMGKSVHSGHYVCHVRQDDGRWILFNDRKVAVSKKPPFELGYLYLFEAV